MIFMNLLLFSIFFLFNFSNGQQIIHLSQLKSSNLVNAIDAQPPYSLYFSGTNDDDSHLKRIYLTTAYGEKKSMYDLKTVETNEFSRQLIPFRVTSNATITTDVAKGALSRLHGFIYITSTKQANEKCFRVHNVDENQRINSDGTTVKDCTFVFLNSNHETSPAQSSKFGGMEQRADAVLKMYRGYPKDDVEGTVLFANPLEVNGKSVVVIPDRFSVSFEVFHFKTLNHVHFQIAPGYIDLNDRTTNGHTTTGFYMKNVGGKPREMRMICYQDTRFEAIVGANIVGQMSKGTVNIKAVDSEQHLEIRVRPKQKKYVWTADLADNLVISSDDSEDGEFFIQWYIVRGKQVSPFHRTRTVAPTSPEPESVFSKVISVFSLI